MVAPETGILLIADPFLKDPNFMRTVVLICDHQPEGTFGFVINKKFEKTIDQLIDNFDGYPIPIYYGGPVQIDTIHFLHQYADIIPGSVEIAKGVYWGGDFNIVTKLVKSGNIDFDKIKFFIGYSGWGEGQLIDEVNEKTWLTVTGAQEIIFHQEPEDIWKDSLRHLGGEYEVMMNFPTDPQLN